MIIDKLEPFWTDEDRAELEEIGKRESSFFESDMLLSASKRMEKSILSMVQEGSEYFFEERERVKKRVLQRYCDSIKDKNEIFMDACEVCEKIEKKDYYRWLDEEKEKSENKIIDLYKSFQITENEEVKKFIREYEKSEKKRVARGYTSYRGFLLQVIYVQREACKQLNHEDIYNKIVDILEEKAAENYTKPSNEKKKKAITEKGYRKMPQSTLSHDFYRSLTDHPEDAPERKKKYNPHSKVESLMDGKNLVMRYTAKQRKKTGISQSDVVIKLLDFGEEREGRIPARKLFKRGFDEMNESHALEHIATPGTDIIVDFPLSDLVECGQYKDIDTAYRMTKKAAAVLVSARIKYEIVRGKKESRIAKFTAPFPTITVTYSKCTIKFNGDIDWHDWMEFYSLMPNFCYELSPKAFDLMEYVFYRARQECDEIADKGCFIISHRALHDNMGLKEEKTKNPKRDIIEVINNAVNKISESVQYGGYITETGTPEIELTPYGKEERNIKDYLDKGFLTVRFNGEPLDYFTSLSRKKRKYIGGVKGKN